MPGRSLKRSLTTVLFTDIVDSTHLASEMRDRRWRDLIARHDHIVRHEIRRFGGREIDSAGDGFFATFDQPADAVRCACSISDAVRELGVEIRAGVHTGEVEAARRKIRGVAVHTGARVMSVGGPSEVLVSSTTRDLVAGSELGFADHGLHTLKGVDGEWRLSAVASVDGKLRPARPDPGESAERRSAIEPPPVHARRAARIAAGTVLAAAMAIAAILVFTDDGGDQRTAPTGPASAPPLNSLVQIDPTTMEVVRVVTDVSVFAPGGNPRIAVGEGSIWARSLLLVRVDPDTGTIDDEIAQVGGNAVGASLSVAVGFRTVWVPGGAGVGGQRSTLHRVNPATGEPLSTIALEPESIATDVAVGERAVWVSFANGTLEEIDPNTGKVLDDIQVGGNLDAVAAGEGSIWVLDQLQGVVTPVDPRKGKPGKPIDVSSNTRYIAAGEGGLWALDTTAHSVQFVETSAERADPPIAVGTEPNGLAVGLDAVWIADGDGSLYRLDPVTLQATPIRVGAPLAAVAVDPETGTLWAIVTAP